MGFSAQACYAALNADFQSSITDAFFRMVFYVIDKNHLNKIDIQTLCKLFLAEFGFEIPFFPMKSIINDSVKEKYVTNTRGDYYRTSMMKGLDSFEIAYQDNAKKYSDFVRSFIKYADSSFNVDYTEDAVNDIISQFVKEEGLTFFQSGMTQSRRVDDKQKYHFSKYIGVLQNDDMQKYDFLQSIIVGKILTSLIGINVEYSSSSNKHITTVYFDTGVIFRLLNIDFYSRGDIYVSLVSDIQKLGLQTKIFSHTLNEIATLISNSKDWINNPDYDPLKASEATRFFVDNNYTVGQIEELEMSLESILEEYNIDIECLPSYPQQLPRGIATEQAIFDLIIERYQQNSMFDKSAKQNTIDFDAKSLFWNAFLNEGIASSKLQTLKAIFITTNNTLVSVGKQYYKNSTNWMPDSVSNIMSDMEIGYRVWLYFPGNIISVAKKRLEIAALSAFHLTESMLIKFNNSLDALKERGDISDAECYMLRASKMAREMLAEIVQGDESRFTDETPLDVIRKIKEEGFSEGKEEQAKIYEEKVSELSNEIAKTKSEREIDKKISNLEKDKLRKEHSLENFKKDIVKIKEPLTRKSTWVFVIILVVIVVIIISGLVLAGNDLISNRIEIILCIAPIVCGYFSLWLTGEKDLNIIHWRKNFIEYNLKKQLTKQGYQVKSEKVADQIEILVEELKHIDNLISELNQEREIPIKRDFNI